MLTSEYFKSLTKELDALKNRVRNFIEDRHWLTDGEWKESVLRAFLKRNLPKSVQIGRGFIITNNTVSKQIDILIYDSTKPVLFQDGDLVFLTPDAVIGVIEVKSLLYKASFKKAIESLCAKAEMLESWYPTNLNKRVIGLFSYDHKIKNIRKALEAINSVVNGNGSRIINLVCLGHSNFIRYWNGDPKRKRIINKWHAYKLEEMAYGYFIHNIVEAICPHSVNQFQNIWYPEEGKEDSMIGSIGLKDNIEG